MPSPLSAVMINQLGGAVRRVGEDETAFAHRGADYDLHVMATWTDPAASAANVGWARGVWEAMRPYGSGGVYVNYLGEEGADRVAAAYGPAKYARLVALKNAYDPTNLFRLNQNIEPTG